jgi:hypothetical protein
VADGASSVAGGGDVQVSCRCVRAYSTCYVGPCKLRSVQAVN